LEIDLERGVEGELKRLVWAFTPLVSTSEGLEPVRTRMNIDENDDPKIQKYRFRSEIRD
jgi:hypothetical protein